MKNIKLVIASVLLLSLSLSIKAQEINNATVNEQTLQIMNALLQVMGEESRTPML